MTRTRQNKKKDFDEFYNNSEEIFKKIQNNDNRSQKFERDYKLNVNLGNLINGGKDKRVIEIYWGSRNYEFEKQKRNWKTLTEYGASLNFYRNDTGDVTISIYPAFTAFIKPFETSIILHICLDPKKLKSKDFIMSLWNDFMAYMEYTSLDGEPTLFQKLKILYLRNFKNLVIDNKCTPKKYSLFIKEVLKYVITVGLSGFIIYLVTIFSQPTNTKIEKLLEGVNGNLDVVSFRLDKISETNSDVKAISKTMDSICIKTKEIIKVIQKQKRK